MTAWGIILWVALGIGLGVLLCAWVVSILDAMQQAIDRREG